MNISVTLSSAVWFFFHKRKKKPQLNPPKPLETYLIVFKDHSCCWICCFCHLFVPCRFARKIVFSQFWVRVDFGVRCRIWRVWRGRRWERKSARTSSFKFIVVTPSATSLAENNKIVFTHCTAQISITYHSMATANLNKSEELVRNTIEILPQHQSTYLRGQESASFEIPPFRSKFT